MGSAYAIYMGLMQIATASSKSTGISIFNNQGQTRVALTTAALSLISVVLALCLDSTKLSVKTPGNAPTAKKKGILSGLNVAMLPLAICCGLCIFPNTVDGNFTALMAECHPFLYTVLVVSGS